jgi:serine/threonine protein kinase
VPDFELVDFEITQELPGREHRCIFRATSKADQKPVLLTVFSAEISQRAEFRRGLKTDRAMLSMLHHQSIVRFIGSGESGGQLFYWTETCDFESLSSALEQGRRFSSDDIIEIGWQICSALQQAHNLGLAHGGISADSVLISDNLQVMVIEFGVGRWLEAARSVEGSENSGPALITISALASREEVELDLARLAAILIDLLKTSTDSSDSPESGRVSTHGPLERFLARVTSTNPAQRPVSAREFQGRLGEILIGSDDDSMPLVDQRESVGKSRRSIVVELFEPTTSPTTISADTNPSAGFAWRRQILPILIGIAVIVLITLLAGLLN